MIADGRLVSLKTRWEKLNCPTAIAPALAGAVIDRPKGEAMGQAAEVVAPSSLVKAMEVPCGACE
jgi:hypothetical protein